jgi:hypothetical protein
MRGTMRQSKIDLSRSLNNLRSIKFFDCEGRETFPEFRAVEIVTDEHGKMVSETWYHLSKP